MIQTSIEGFTLRFAEQRDVPLILTFIKELAAYEKMSKDVVATESILEESLFTRKMAEVILGEYRGEPVAFALFFHNFSTFLGKPGIYLEDLFVRPLMRGKGIGKIILAFLAKTAVERDCGRLEWACLDWNEPSIEFYKQMGAVQMDEWTVHRLANEQLVEMAKRFV